MARLPATDPWGGARALTPASVSFTRQPATGGPTLDALMRRQKELAARQAALGQGGYPGEGTIAGGLGNMVNQFTTGLAAKQAEEQEASQRAALAQLLSGYDPTGSDAQQIAAQAYGIDPDLSVSLMAGAAQARAAAKAAEMAASQRVEDRQWRVEDREDTQAAAVEQARARAVADAETYQRLTPDEIKAAGLDPSKAYQRSSKTQKVSPIGGEGVTINTGDTSSALRKKFDEKEGELWNTYVAAGAKAAALTNDMTLLDELGKVAPQGPVPGALQKMFPGLNSAGAAYTSVVTRLAPQMRVEGSGATSDIEYLGMVNSLPKLGNYPEANQLIGGMMKAKAAIDMDRAHIITQWRNQQLDDAGARTALEQLNRRSIMTPELRELLAAVGGGEAGAAPDDGIVKIERID